MVILSFRATNGNSLIAGEPCGGISRDWPARDAATETSAETASGARIGFRAFPGRIPALNVRGLLYWRFIILVGRSFTNALTGCWGWTGSYDRSLGARRMDAPLSSSG
jgi:hypothetical protein